MILEPDVCVRKPVILLWLLIISSGSCRMRACTEVHIFLDMWRTLLCIVLSTFKKNKSFWHVREHVPDKMYGIPCLNFWLITNEFLIYGTHYLEDYCPFSDLCRLFTHLKKIKLMGHALRQVCPLPLHTGKRVSILCIHQLNTVCIFL